MSEGELASLSRRTLLKSAAAVAGASIIGRAQTAAEPWRAAISEYLAKHARPDGGYAWDGQPHSHLTPTFAVVGCYRLLGMTPPHPDTTAEFVRTHHPSQLKKLEQEHHDFEIQQIQALLWLNADPSFLKERVRSWTGPATYLKQYEQHGWPILRHETAAFVGRQLLGLPLDDLSPQFIAYLESRRRPDGSFNSTPAEDSSPGHVLNTWWGLRALQTLKRHREHRDSCVDWIQKCQLASGGFTYQSEPKFAGNDDVAYTWAAVRSLALLDAEPRDRTAAVRCLASLWQSNGGFSDRPDWDANPLATYYAVDALAALNALDSLAAIRPPASRPRRTLSSDLQVFSIQLEAHGQGSPTEAVELARALRIHLWGAKNAKPEWLARAQNIADERQVPVRFFVANEEYGTWVDVPGLGTYSHTSDIIAPADRDIGPSLANQGVVSWPEFRRRRLTPLRQAGGHLVWQFGENEELVRLYLDDSVERGGYAAISTFHFGNPDFTNSEPFLNRWHGRIPFVALQDAHGTEPWWFADMTTGFRTLFLAKEPTWDGWLDALAHNRVAAVRHDAVSRFETWRHGPAEVLEFLADRELEWRWWDNPDIARPWVSLVVVRPEDRFEAARPDAGVTLRVRCAWENTTQGLPKRPLAELQSLAVDDQMVETKVVAPRSSRGNGLADHYHEYRLPASAVGRHKVLATIKLLHNDEIQRQTLIFDVAAP